MRVQILMCLTLTWVMTSLTEARRLPRPTANLSSPRKTVEVVVIVDRPAHQQWRQWQRGGGSEEERERRTVEAITGFVNATFLSANLIFKGMEEFGVSLDLRIHTVRIVKDRAILTPGADGRSVDNDAAYWQFYYWLIRNGFEFDHALLLTGLDLVSDDNTLHEGYAYMDTMCSPQSLSLVENIINGIPAVVFAHEVGHSLSARHDGGRNNHCNGSSGHIMNANKIGTSSLHWNFSTCSARAIVSKLEGLEALHDCLSAEGGTRSPPVESPYLGQLYTGDELCQRSQGNQSYVCRHLYGRPDSRSICQVLWCLVNATYCTGLAPVDGLPCASGKRCLAGSCVPFEDVAGDVTDRCYTGDKPGFAWRNQTCGEVVGSYTHLCSDQWYQDFCCHTCLGHYTGNDACPYGDAHDQCRPYYCGTRWESECCDTCPP